MTQTISQAVSDRAKRVRLLIIDKKVSSVMTKGPTAIKSDRLAAEAFEILRSKKIDELPVVDNKYHPIGLLDVQDLLKAGLV